VKTIKDMPEHSRPREKLREKGASVLTDEELVADIEAERTLVESNRKLIEVFEKKIQNKIAEIWGEDETARKSTKET